MSGHSSIRKQSIDASRKADTKYNEVWGRKSKSLHPDLILLNPSPIKIVSTSLPTCGIALKFFVVPYEYFIV